MTIKEKLMDYLIENHIGAENAVNGGKLSAACGVSNRVLRNAINELRAEEEPICSNSSGYFYASSASEVAVTMAHLASRSREMIKAREGLNRAKSHFPIEETSPLGGNK